MDQWQREDLRRVHGSVAERGLEKGDGSVAERGLEKGAWISGRERT